MVGFPIFTILILISRLLTLLLRTINISAQSLQEEGLVHFFKLRPLVES